jgi:hypothetical protein
MIQEFFDTICEALAMKTPEDREATRVSAQKAIDRKIASKRRYSERLPALRAKRFARYNTHQTAGLENWNRNKHNIIVSTTGRAVTPPGNWSWVSGLSAAERKIVLDGSGTVVVRGTRPARDYAGTPFENYRMVMVKFKGAYGNEDNCAYDMFGRSTCHGPQMVYVPRAIPEDLYHDVRRALAMQPVDEALAGKTPEDKEKTYQSRQGVIDRYRKASTARVAKVQAEKPAIKTPHSEAQKVFQEMVEGFIADLQGQFAREFPDSPKYQTDTFGMDLYAFHDPDHVSVDGTLYEVMNGQADYNFGMSWREALWNALKDIGYYMEPDNGSEWFFAKEDMQFLPSLRGPRVQEGLRDKVLAGVLAVGLMILSMAPHAGAWSDPSIITIEARAIVGEAEDQGLDGMRAVASAIRNKRDLSAVYGLQREFKKVPPQWVWDQAQKAWDDSRTHDYANGANHWGTDADVEKWKTQPWFKHAKFVMKIGDHNFYKEGV